MRIEREQIDLWLDVHSETQRLEFKEAKDQFGEEKLCQYCVAIANEGGGFLVLGVTDKQPRRVVGSKAFRDTLDIAQKLLVFLGFRVDVHDVVHPEGRVVVFEIPGRLRGSAYAYKGAYFMRSGASLVPMTEDRLRQIFAENAPDWLEQQVDGIFGEQDIVDLLDTQTFFELLDSPYPSSRDGVIEKLLSMKLIDKVSRGFAIRRMGALLLAKNVRRFPDVERKAPRVIVYNGTSKQETRLDQPGAKGLAIGFEGLVGFVLNQLPQNEIIRDALRREEKLVPEIVVRELIANALVHQDFVIQGVSPVIEIYSNRLEISSPGKPLVPLNRFIDESQTRNERLVGLMRRFGICEEKGSGLDKVISAIEAVQLPPLDLRESNLKTITVVHGSKPFESMSKKERVLACYQHAVLKWVMSETMTNQSLRLRFHLPEGKSATVSQIISAAAAENLIKLDESCGGGRKFARYIPTWA